MGAVTTLNANEELVFFQQFNANRKIKISTRKFSNFEALLHHFSDKEELTESTDWCKGVFPSLEKEFPNIIKVSCQFHLSRKNVYPNYSDQRVFKFKNTTSMNFVNAYLALTP